MKGGLNKHIEVQNRALAVKRDAMVAALGENFGGSVTWSVPQGGLYIWVKFPEGTDLAAVQEEIFDEGDRKSTRLNSSHVVISYAVFCLKKKKNN